MNPLIGKVEQSVTLRVANEVRRLERLGSKVIRLHTGDPDFRTPEPVTRAAEAALNSGITHYSDTRGLPELREAIASRLLEKYGLNYDAASDIAITSGGIHAIFCTISALISAGDEVIIIDPCWMPYVSAVAMAGGSAVRIASDPHDGFRPPISEISKRITSRTRLIILNSPCNPSGVVFDEAELEALATLAVRHNLVVIADEVYAGLVYDKWQHRPIASYPGMIERTVLVDSFSKTFAMTGWRLGYIAAPDVITSAVVKMAEYSITNVAPFIQKAGVAALTDKGCALAVDEMKQIYSRRRAWLNRELSRLDGIRFSLPQGAFYFLLDVSQFSRNSESFAKRLLQESLLATIPGVGFGLCSEGFLRLTFAASDAELKEGLQRLAGFLQQWNDVDQADDRPVLSSSSTH